MIVHEFTLGELQSNCYILENSGECLIVDPADEILSQSRFNDIS